HQQRPEPLAARVQEVPGGGGDELRLAGHVAAERVLHVGHPRGQPLGEVLVEDRQGEAGEGAGVAHLMNSPAWAARSSTGPATIGDSLPRPAHRDRWVASPPASRTMETIANAPSVMNP